ncbi:hypothetical protein ACFPIF_15195 [Brevundimonas faecalis]|uniref:hypothetical protein n=1 Tax=Brevundimonas faecalis TaxID=947378 RepID=UPI0036071B38
MVRSLPSSPEPRSPFTYAVMRLRNDVTSMIGGNRQRNLRKGDHYVVDFNLPPMAPEEVGPWRKLMTAADTLLMRMPQPGFDVGAPGAPQVNGGPQLGSLLRLKGLTPGYKIRQGQFFSIVTADRRWLYAADADATADAAGIVSVPLEVMIRTAHFDGDVVEMADPKIEGLPQVEEDAFTVAEDGHVWLSFSIEERG